MVRFWKSDERLREQVVEAFDMVVEKNESLREENSKLRRELDRPTDEALADAHAQIIELKEKVEKMQRNSLYVMSEEQKTKSYEWWKEHRKTCPGKGRHMEWAIIGTGLGDCLYYRCIHCEDSIDLTDTSNW